MTKCATDMCFNDAKGRNFCGRCNYQHNKADREACMTKECPRLALLDETHCRPCKNRLNRRDSLISLGADPNREKQCSYCLNQVSVLDFPVNAHSKDCSGKQCYPCQQKIKVSKKTEPAKNVTYELMGGYEVSARMASVAIV